MSELREALDAANVTGKKAPPKDELEAIRKRLSDVESRLDYAMRWLNALDKSAAHRPSA